MCAYQKCEKWKLPVLWSRDYYFAHFMKEKIKAK